MNSDSSLTLERVLNDYFPQFEGNTDQIFNEILRRGIANIGHKPPRPNTWFSDMDVCLELSDRLILHILSHDNPEKYFLSREVMFHIVSDYTIARYQSKYHYDVVRLLTPHVL